MLSIVVIILFCCFNTIEANNVGYVQDLIDRVLTRGNINFQFKPILQIVSQGNDIEEWYEIDSNNNKIIFRGTSNNAITAAFGYYLRFYLKCDFHWEDSGGYSFNSFPKELNLMPIPTKKSRTNFLSKYRYYQNTCTASYSFVWRDWASYEMEIDWMAMNGINLPLSFNGQEYVWTKLWESYGINQEGLDEFFTGPAYLAWNRMANLRAFGGPLPSSFITQQMEMQKKILKRYKELSMQPVLPAFNGVVPQQMISLYPNANITQLASWATFVPFPEEDCCNYLIDSEDPLFVEIGLNFLQLQSEIYGNVTKFYNVDTFNENDPSSQDPAFLKSQSAVVYSYMNEFDKDSIWIMQAWMFINNPTFWTDSAIEAYLSGVPDKSLIILDLFADEHPVWPKLLNYSKPFIWCMLHSFGGNRAIYGNITAIINEPILAKAAAGSLFLGTGLTMEAIDQNPIMYELMNEIAMLHHDESVDESKWISEYATRRYNIAESPSSINHATDAWTLLHSNNYMQSSTLPCEGGDYNIICPSFKSVVWMKPLINTTQFTYGLAGPLVQVWESLQKVDAEDVSAWRYDLVDVSRQVLVNLFYDVYCLFKNSYERKDIDSITLLSKEMLSIVSDWNDILSTHEGYIMGIWIERARNLGYTEDEKDLYDFNARNQVTLWGDYGEIDDYAAKNWGGLAINYYYKRWNLLTNMAIESLNNNHPFNVDKYNSEELKIGQHFCHDYANILPVNTIGNTDEVSLKLQAKYGNLFISSNEYTIIKNMTTIHSNNLLSDKMWTNNIKQLMYLCDIDLKCKGFDSIGYMKSSYINQIESVNVDLYIKN